MIRARGACYGEIKIPPIFFSLRISIKRSGISGVPVSEVPQLFYFFLEVHLKCRFSFFTPQAAQFSTVGGIGGSTVEPPRQIYP